MGDSRVATSPDALLLVCRRLADLEEYRQAYDLMTEMRERIPGVQMGLWMKQSVVEDVHRALGIPLGRGTGADEAAADEGDDEIPDETAEF